MDLSVSTMVSNTRETTNKNIIIINYVCNLHTPGTNRLLMIKTNTMCHVHVWVSVKRVQCVGDVVVIFQWHREIYSTC